MPRRTNLVTLVIVVGLSFATACSTSAPKEEAPEQMSKATGETLLQERCTVCHSLNRVEQAQKSQEDWEKTVSRMIDKGAELNQEEQAILITHLTETYGPLGAHKLP